MLIRLLLLLAAALSFAACVAPTRSEGVLMEEQVVDGVTIGFEAVASPRLNRPTELAVTLTDAQGQPIDGATVSFNLTMPAMPMGTNAPIAEGVGSGRYTAPNVVMDMTGDWEIEVIAGVDGAEHRAVFTRVVIE